MFRCWKLTYTVFFVAALEVGRGQVHAEGAEFLEWMQAAAGVYAPSLDATGLKFVYTHAYQMRRICSGVSKVRKDSFSVGLGT